ncbi:hypothetical protein I4U23_022519 [Adineta vaga]|nr:hypothetical protein I4U23_022519 [Adineta vaga]
MASKVSEFYWTCRNGDIQRVKELLNCISFEDLNHIESNGSTPLQAATYYGHTEIIRLLLIEYDCLRHQINCHGLTAYEEAQTEKIRELFYRPGGINRFCDDKSMRNESNKFETNVENNNDQIDDGDDYDDSDVNEVFKGDRWLEGCSNSNTKEMQQILRLFNTCLQLKLFGKIADRRQLLDTLNKIIDHYVTTNHKQYKKCTLFAKKGLIDDEIEQSIRLYTLQTPFYITMALYSSLLLSLDKLKGRHFRGTCYRGVRITEHSIYAYRWSLKYHGTI